MADSTSRPTAGKKIIPAVGVPKKAAPAAAGPRPQTEPERKTAAARQPVHRAGGHADYGDGRGWIVEE